MIHLSIILTRSVAALENMFVGQGILWQQVWNCLSNSQNQDPGSDIRDNSGQRKTLSEYATQFRETLSDLSTDSDVREPHHNPSKRQHRDSTKQQSQQATSAPVSNDESYLPHDDLINDLVEIYFKNIHPWIPILHVQQFRQRMGVPSQRKLLTNIFHAIVSTCVRFSIDPRLSDAAVRSRYTSKCRQVVILNSMESFSVENLQALVICAFDTVS